MQGNPLVPVPNRPLKTSYQNTVFRSKEINAQTYLLTTPITPMGRRQCLPLIVVQLKCKCCRKPHCRNRVVDMFKHCVTRGIKYFLDFCVNTNFFPDSIAALIKECT